MTKDGESPEPESYEKAMRSSEREGWKQATYEEMESMYKNHTWDIIDKPESKRVIGCKWVFKRNAWIDGVESPMYKARLLAKGFHKKKELITKKFFPM